MKASLSTFLFFVLSTCVALAQSPVVVGDGQRAVIENEGGAAPVVPKKVALVVQNHCVPLAGIPMEAMTDALSARLTHGALRIVNPHNVIGMTQNTTAAGEEMPPVSAVDLAREVGAEGIVTASVTEFLESTIGTPVDLYQFFVRVTLNLADAGSGAGVCGATIYTNSPKYTVNQVDANRPVYLGNMLHSAVEACADKLLSDPAIAAWKPEGMPAGLVRAIRLRPGETLSVSVMDAVLQRLFENMRLSPLFREKYDAAAVEWNRRPIIIIGGMADKTDENAGDVLEAAGQGLRVSLRSSGLFDLKDDAMMVTFAERIIDSGNSPLENADLMTALKQHGSPDFYVEGDVRAFPGIYRVRLALHSLHSGMIVWEGIENIYK